MPYGSKNDKECSHREKTKPFPVFSLIRIITKKANREAQRIRVFAMQAWEPKFNPQIPCKSESCPLVSTHALWGTFTHTQTETYHTQFFLMKQCQKEIPDMYLTAERKKKNMQLAFQIPLPRPQLNKYTHQLDL